MDEELIVPSEFIEEPAASEPAPVDSPAPRRVISGPIPKDVDAGMSFRGSQRSNSILGAVNEAADISVARSTAAPVFDQTERQRLDAASGSDNPVEALRAARALRRKDDSVLDAPTRRQSANDRILEQELYDNSPSFQSVAGTLSSFAGAVASPENVGGLGWLVTKVFPALATRTIARTAADAALTNTITDPIVQGIRTTSGGQEDYNLLQTALAPVIGGAFGGVLGGAGVAVSRGIERMDMNRAFDPRLTPEERAADMRIASESFAIDQTSARTASSVDPQPFGPMAGAAQGRFTEPASPLSVDVTARLNEPRFNIEALPDPERVNVEDLRALIDRRAPLDELRQHPALTDAVRRMEEVEPTNMKEGYGTDNWAKTREFDFNGEKVTGYEAAIPRLVQKAESYSTGAPVDAGKQAYIVIGAPAVGKSTFAEGIASRTRSAIVDSDDAKAVLPEYEGGIGANAVHEESSTLADLVLANVLRADKNIVVPKVGGSPDSMKTFADKLRALGYDVHLVHVDVAPDEAFNRMLGRFARTGRLINLDYFNSIGDKPRQTYAQLRDEGALSSYAQVDANGPPGSARLKDGGGRAAEALALDGGRRGTVPRESKPDPRQIDSGASGAAEATRSEGALASYAQVDANGPQGTARLADGGGRAAEALALDGGRRGTGGAEDVRSPAQDSGRAPGPAAEPARSAQEVTPPTARAEPAPPSPTNLIGDAVPAIPAHRVSTAAGSSIEVAPIIVEADSLRTSMDDGYDASLQPRDRDRAASQAQIREIATRLDPERLGFSAEADRGAPIVGPDAMVESGNGRVLAIRRAYEQGGDAAVKYRAWLSQQGVDLSQYREPVLVRQRLTDLAPEQRQAFTVEANQAATLSMSAGERAMSDARMLKAETLDLIRNANDLGAQGNRDFTQAFIRGLPQSEQGMMATADGGLSSEGLTRIRNAVLAKAYSDGDLMARVAEATSDDIKSISNALTLAAPDWAKFRADVDAGLVRADMDLTTELMEAVKRTADLRAKGTSLDMFLRQQDAFDSVSAPVEAWMRMFYQPDGKRAAGGPAMAERLRFFAQEARKTTADDGLGFDLPPIRAEDLQSLAAKRGASDATAQATGNLFESSRLSDGAGDGASRGEPGGSVLEEGGRGSEPPRAGGDRDGTPGTAGKEEVAPRVRIIEGKGLIKGKYLAEIDGNGVPDGPWPTPESAQAAAESWGRSQAEFAQKQAGIRADKDRLIMRLREGGEVTGADLKLLNLRAGSSELKYFIPIAAELFGIKSRQVRPFIKSIIKTGTSDGGTKLEFVQPKDGLAAIAKSLPEDTLPENLSRRGGQSPAQQPLGNQIEMGRPKADQGTTPIADAAIVRLEDIAKQLIDGFDAIARIGRVTGGAEGKYNLKTGVVRARTPSDLDTLTHEIGHSFHMQSEAKADLDAIVRTNTNELQQFGAGQGAEGNAEAFANLFHAYVTNLPYAQMNYPNAAAALDSLMRARFPDQIKVIEGVRQALDVIHRSPSVDVVRADTITTQPPKFGDRFRELVASDKDPQGRVVYSAMDSLYTQSVDLNHPVYQAVEQLAKIAAANGKPLDIKPVDDAYMLARRLPGSHGSADAMLKYGVIPAGKVSPEGPSLSSGIEKALGKKWDAQAFENFGAYLAARRMVAEYQRFFAGQLERAPGKLSIADYQKAVTDFEASNPAFKAGAQDIYAFQRNHLKRQFDKGLVTREYYEEALKRDDYVPAMRDMRNFEDGEAASGNTSMGGNGLLSRTIMKRFRGSDRPVINPLESIFKRVHDIEFAIARNDSINALARLADEAGPGAGFIYEDIPSNQLKGQRVDVMEALKSAGKTAGIDKQDLTQMMLQVEDVLGDSTWATIFRQEPIQEGAEPIIYRWVNGERRAGRLGDDRFARELHHALTSMSDYEKDFLTNVLAMSSAILRTGITKSLDFMSVNMIRDQSTAMLTAGRKYVPFVSMAKGLVEALQKTDDAIEFAGQGGLAGGAIVEAVQSSNFGRNVKSLQGGNWFGEVLKAFELSETGTRLGLYKSYIEQAKALGFDAENAALYAAFKADDYIDFRKHGAAMGIPRRIFTFMNAAIQGTDKEIRAAVDLPVLEAKRARGETLTSMELDRLKDARVGMIRLVTMGIVMGSVVAFMNADNEEYKNASKYWRATTSIIPIPGMDKPLTLPKGFGIVQSVVNLFERGAEFAMRGDPALAGEWLEGAAKAFSMPASNPALTLMYDVPANYDRFRDRNIVPYYMQGWDATEQYSKYTSAFAKQLSKAADMAGLKLSPMKIDYTIQQLGGGLARDALFGWDVMMANDRPEKQVYDYPVLRRFVKNLARGSAASENFYKLVGEKTGSYEQAENAFRGKINNGERAGAAEYLRNLKEDERAWVTLNTLGFESKAKQLHPMMNARERVALSNGIVRQLVNGNVIKEEDMDRRDLTRSRRDAQPIALTPRDRALLQEEFLDYSVASARNAMVSVGAKGTVGLKQMDTAPILERIRLLSPAVADEFAARVDNKNLPSVESSAAAWPEMKRRLLVDGESAELEDLIPADVARRAKRRR